MPRHILRAVPEPKASEYLAAFEAGFMSELLVTTPASGASPAPVGSSSGGRAATNPAAAQAPLGGVVPVPAAPTTPAITPAESAPYKAMLFASEGHPAAALRPGGAHLRAQARPRLITAAPAPATSVVAPDGRPLTRSCWVLGAGAFGVTFRVEDTRDHSEAALKATRPVQSPEEREFFFNESYIATAVDHPNVLPAAGPPIETQLEPGGPVLRCLVTPYCEGGDLDGVIRRHLRSPSAADRQERWLLLGDLLRGLAYLHGQPFRHNRHRVLHNDIKPANVLLRRQVDPATGTVRPMALLADLGLACVYTGGTLVSCGLARGTPGFMAPEMFAAAEAGLRPGNTPATDVYAMGVTLFCLYSQTDTAHKTEEQPSEPELRAAFAEVAAREQATRGAKGVRGGQDSLAELLVRMCSESPTSRPSAERLLGALEAIELADGASRKSAEEAPRKAAEAEARRKAAAEAEARRRQAAALEEARRKQAEEQRAAKALRRKAAEEEEARRKAAEEEEARRTAAEEEHRQAQVAAVLSQARSCTGTRLDLVGQGMTDRCVVALAAWLATNRVVTRFCLSASPPLSSLVAFTTQLNFGQNQIGDEGARALAQNSAICELYLFQNQIGDEGAHAFAAALPQRSSIEVLDLGQNRIGDEGARALAAALPQNRSLRENQFGTDGARASPANSTLRSLVLPSGVLGPEEEQSLRQRSNGRLRFLELARSDFSSVAERKTADLQVTGSIPVGRLPFADSLGVGVFFGLDLQSSGSHTFFGDALFAYTTKIRELAAVDEGGGQSTRKPKDAQAVEGPVAGTKHGPAEIQGNPSG
ncbi:putative Protein kinase domain [Paratrimastix pyriformis]|uniref:Protein kinase domain-containing protein n=1 Tax=Paratrimastix pyriformis TaxID=342808 RepID=A0ABQ8UGY7_9EUKA|nr:putative Protein kinase domain [Paratrimastix pyriformis]